MTANVKDPTFLSYMKSINQYPILNKAEEYAVAKEFKNTGDPRLAKKLVTSNLKFVAKIAYKYCGTGHEMMDIIQEGNEGLIAAVRKFDPDKGYKLISYAVWWIKAYINRYIISNHSQVKIGTTQAQRSMFFSLRSDKAKLINEKGTEHITIEELAEYVGQEAKDVAEMEMRIAARDFSMQNTLDSEPDGVTFQDRLADTEPRQDKLVEDSIMAARIRELVSKLELNPKERYIVDHRLMNSDPCTLQDIGTYFKVSRERIRQIESNLKTKIRKALLANNDIDESQYKGESASA